MAYRDFTPAAIDLQDKEHAGGQWLCNPEMRALAAGESQRRADAGDPFVIRFRVQRESAYEVKFPDEVYGVQRKLTPDIEDFALLRSNGMPTYHLAFCAADIDLNITHIIRGQDHLSNTFKHEGVNRSNAVVNFSESDPIDPKAQWLNSQHLRSLPIENLTPLVKKVLEDHKLEPYGNPFFAHVVDTIRSRYSTLLDFPLKGRSCFADDFHMEKQALEELDVPGARALLHELAERIARNPEFSEASVEADLRKLAEERGAKAEVLINASRAALTGQSVGPSAFAVFVCIGRERAVHRLEKV